MNETSNNRINYDDLNKTIYVVVAKGKGGNVTVLDASLNQYRAEEIKKASDRLNGLIHNGIVTTIKTMDA